MNKVSCKGRCLCKVFIQCIFIVRLLCARQRARRLEYGRVHRYSPCKPQNAHKNHWQCSPNILEPSCKQMAHRVNSGMFFNVYTLFFKLVANLKDQDSLHKNLCPLEKNQKILAALSSISARQQSAKTEL